MPIEKRTRYNTQAGGTLGSGAYLATVIDVLDPTFNGRLKVSLLRDQGNAGNTDGQTYLVNYASPFFGHTPYEALGMNKDDFKDTQQSYGMWAVPPDVGVTVMVMFIEGNPSSGYWFACVPPRFANHMVPAIGAADTDPTGARGEDQTSNRASLAALSEDDKKKFNTKMPLPVGEINKRLNGSGDQEIDAEKIPKPVHPITDRFFLQGLLEDDARGVTTTTSRRNNPNAVFGISTPGPLDYGPNGKRMRRGTKENLSVEIPVTRLGGTQFVMDDGDDRYIRKTSPQEGPVEYVEASDANTSAGLLDLPYNEYTRLRTRTGHQLLLHNSEDLIYIGNAKGTSWVELTSNGKVDVFANDSVSVHSMNDINIKADRDINMEAGRNVNIKATAEYQAPDSLHQDAKIEDALKQENGRVQIESAFNTNILIGANGKIETRMYTNAEDLPLAGDLDISVAGNHRHFVGGTTDIQTIGDRSDTQANWDINTGGYNYLTSGANTEVASGGDIIMSASPNIHFNGPAATGAAQADTALTITDLIKYDNPLVNPLKDWATTKWQDGTITSIMRRIPMHEPWLLHENQAPQFVTALATDREEKQDG